MTSTVQLRGYQTRILDVALQHNVICLLPTGSGKTFIAAEAIVNIGTPAVFFVPTIPLVEQQAAALRSRPNMPTVGEFHGDKAFPTHFDVLVTTPKAFETVQSRGMPSLAWNKFKVVVLDEVHHTLKDHPYRNLALRLKMSGHHPRVIGLTASLTYAVGAQKIKKSVDRLCKDLRIDQIEYASEEELLADGYLGATRRTTEVRVSTQAMKPEIVPPEGRKPHLMHSTFFGRIDTGEATSFAADLVSIVKLLEEDVKRTYENFASPLGKSSLKVWGGYAKKNFEEHNDPRFASLENWYEALRILVVSWEEADDAATAFLRMRQCDRSLPCWSNDASTAIESFFKAPSSSARFDNLFDALQEKVIDYDDFRGIIFVKQRVMTHILEHVLSEHPVLRSYASIRCLYSAKTPATASLSITRGEGEDSLRAFRSGEANLLISTNVAEEGLDVPAANCVIYYDSIDHSVSYVQGQGRARQADSSFVVLSERSDRPAALLAQQEVDQHELAASFTPCVTEEVTTADLNSQRQREENGIRILVVSPTNKNALANLNIFCKKTKVVLTEKVNGATTSCSTCHMTYQSILRTIEVSGEGNGKQAARKAAAHKMLRAIADSISSNP